MWQIEKQNFPKIRSLMYKTAFFFRDMASPE